MSAIEIINNEYQTICDTHGCNNIGISMIGKPGESIREHRIMCNECLQNIINAAPLEMILNRPELAVEDEGEIEGIIDIDDKFKLENVGKALEGEEVLNPMCFEEMNFTELKEIAKSKGLQFKVGMGKPQLIKYLEGTE